MKTVSKYETVITSTKGIYGIKYGYQLLLNGKIMKQSSDIFENEDIANQVATKALVALITGHYQQE